MITTQDTTPEKRKRSAWTFPFKLKNIIYLDILNKGSQVLRLNALETNGKTKSEIQDLIGGKLGAGNYYFSLMLEGDPVAKTGRIRGTVNNPAIKMPAPISEAPNRESAILHEIEVIKNQLNNTGTANNINEFLAMYKSTYEIQINFYKARVDDLTRENEVLRDKLHKIELEANQSGGLGDLILPLLINKLGLGNLAGGALPAPITTT
jgi:hypothetical protein